MNKCKRCHGTGIAKILDPLGSSSLTKEQKFIIVKDAISRNITKITINGYCKNCESLDITIEQIITPVKKIEVEIKFDCIKKCSIVRCDDLTDTDNNKKIQVPKEVLKRLE